MEVVKNFLTKFTNGEERYQQSQLFHSVVLALLSGADPTSIIDKLLTVIDRLNDENIRQLAQLRKMKMEITIITDANNSILAKLPRTEEGTEKTNPSEH
ncbi:MAG TPA: hypothetical protein VK145_02740 [Candidatus Nanoarchaeia archaeon]|nr:hypothetical protein [Candidatus Nanoarchaeia archaeon]